jgi:phosphate:Na+ symporter
MNQISEADSNETIKMLKIIGDFERIADHAVNLVESAEELKEKDLRLSAVAGEDLKALTDAVREILQLTLAAFLHNDLASAKRVDPLEQRIDDLKEQMRTRHIIRLQLEQCSIEVGFVWSDLLTNLERVSDHCSNIARCILDLTPHSVTVP